MSCFADTNVAQGSVATYAVLWDFQYPFNYKYTKESSSENFFKWVKIWQTYGHESVATLFLAHPVDK